MGKCGGRLEEFAVKGNEEKKGNMKKIDTKKQRKTVRSHEEAQAERKEKTRKKTFSVYSDFRSRARCFTACKDRFPDGPSGVVHGRPARDTVTGGKSEEGLS